MKFQHATSDILDNYVLTFVVKYFTYLMKKFNIYFIIIIYLISKYVYKNKK